MKDPYEAKLKFLINRRESTDLKQFDVSKTFIEYSNDTNEIYNNIEEYDPNKNREILIVFDDMIADILSNKKLNPIVIALFTRGRNLNTSLVFIIQSSCNMFQAKFYALFHYGNSKQTKTSTNCI